MIYTYVQKFGKKKGWYATKTAIFGLHNDYLFNIHQDSFRHKTIICQTETLKKKQKIDLEQLFAQNQRKLGYATLKVKNDFVALTFSEHNHFTTISTLEKNLNFIAKEFALRNIKNKYNHSEKSNYYNLSGEGVLLNQEEYEIESIVVKELNRIEKLEKSSYFSGFIGSLVYSLPIIILWVMFFKYAKIIGLILILLIILLGILGYEKYNGKLGFWSKLIIFFSNILVPSIATILTTTFTMLQTNLPIEAIDMNQELRMIQLTGLISSFFLFFDFKTRRNYIEEAKKI